MPDQPASRLSRTSEGLTFTGDTLIYRITGLQPYNLERLFITLKASTPEDQVTFHIDKLDLYNSRARESFAETCSKYLKVQPGNVITDLLQLIIALEVERVAMREKGNADPIPTMTKAEESEAMAILKSKDLLTRILSDFVTVHGPFVN